MKEDVAKKFRKQKKLLKAILGRLDDIVLGMDDKEAAKALAQDVREQTEKLKAIPK